MKNLFLLSIFILAGFFCFGQNSNEEISILVNKSNVALLSEVLNIPPNQILEIEDNDGMINLMVNQTNLEKIKDHQIDVIVLDENRSSATLYPVQGTGTWGTGYILYENGNYSRFQGITGVNLIRVGVKQVAHWAPYRGFVKYNITSIPSNATINSVTLHTFTVEASPSANHRTNIKRLNLDPAGSNLEAIFTAINDLATSAYFFYNYDALASGQSGNRTANLNTNARNDLQSKLNSGQTWWALGFIETPNENEIFGSFRGRDQNTPYIVIEYTTPPVADFSGSPTSGVAPLTVNFTNESTGTITSYSWNFGDGTTSIATHPSKTYNIPGTYTVNLTATGPGGSDIKTRTNYINVLQPSGNINITVKNVDETSVPLPGSNGIVKLYNSNWQYLTQTATNSSGIATFSNRPFATYNIEAYHNPNSPSTIFGEEFWGNKNINHNTSPTNVNFQRYLPHFVHTKVYNHATNVEVTNGSVPIGTQLRIVVRLRNPNTVLMSVRPRLVLDKNKLSPYDFDQIASAENISSNSTRDYTFYYTPSSAGEYFCVTGTQTNIEGSFIITDGALWENNPIITIVAPPNADFYGTPTSGDAPLTVNFTNTSTGTITSYLWEFGDGTTSTDTHPSKTYNIPGTYTVNLTATGPGGSDIKTRTNYIFSCNSKYH